MFTNWSSTGESHESSWSPSDTTNTTDSEFTDFYIIHRLTHVNKTYVGKDSSTGGAQEAGS